ncbi:hypothetical protein PENTCL1PPCAC_5706, partial [Pristionchus entomophagus]
VFPDTQMFMIVDDRDQPTYNWIVDLVFRRRAYSEYSRERTRRKVQSEIRTFLNQKASRLREDHGMDHPIPMRVRKQQERQQRIVQIAQQVEARQQEVTAK